MTIRGLEEHLKDRSHLVHELPLAALRDSRLGIDASSYVEGLLKENSTREPFVSGIGGAPLTLADTLHFHLKVLESYSIKPVFVFNGLQPRGTSGQQRERRSAALASKLTIRAAAWEHFENGDEAEAAEAFAKSNSLDAGDAWRTVQRVYKQRNVEHMAAPYLAAAQLIYLEKHDKSYIHAVFGPTELLLYDHIDRLIIGVNWSAQAFSFVSKREILHDLGLSHDQFLGLGLLAGCDYAPTFPAFSQPHAPDYNFRNVVQVLQNFKSAPAAIHYYLESMTHLKSTNVQDQFAQARALVKYPLVLTANQGRVLPLPLALSYTSAGEIPHDLHDVFSHRLPDELYFQFWRGLFSATVLDALVNEVWVDELPLDGGESDDYKRFLREVLSEHPQGPKAVALGLLSSVLNPQYWNKRTVVSDRQVNLLLRPRAQMA